MKIILWILLVIGLIVFFWPKKQIFSCGVVCTQEGFERVTEEIKNTFCIGFEGKAPLVTDATIRVCYGILVTK